LVKIVKKKKTNPIPNPIPVDIIVTFKIIDELKTIYDKEAPIYEIFGREVHLSKLADFFITKFLRLHLIDRPLSYLLSKLKYELYKLKGL